MNGNAIPAIVVGTGFGCRIQVPALRVAGFDVVGLVGTDWEKTHQRAWDNAVPRAFTDLGEAISTTGARVVTIATPPHTHSALTLDAIALGCHVLCEKPFAANAQEARAMLKAAQDAGIVNLVGHEFRWKPERLTMARLVRAGAIGVPRLATFTTLIPYLVDPASDMPGWWFDVDAGGGWLGAAGSHLLDWVRTLLGEFDSLSASLQSLSPAPGKADDSFALRFRLDSGVEGVIQQSAATWGDPLDIIRIGGTTGSVWLQDGQVRLSDKLGTRIVPFAQEDILSPVREVSKDPRQSSPKWQALSAIELPGYIKLCEVFAAMIRGENPHAPAGIPTFADGVAQMEVIDAIRRSHARAGALVSVRH